MPPEYFGQVYQYGYVPFASEYERVLFLRFARLLLDFVPNFSLNQPYQQFLVLNLTLRYDKIPYRLLILLTTKIL